MRARQFAALRPAQTIPTISNRHPGVDLVCVRETTEDIYSSLEHETIPGVYESLKAQGVLVRNFDGGAPALANCLRLTVGSPEENRILIVALREALK